MTEKQLRQLTMLFPLVTLTASTASVGYQYYRREELRREFIATQQELARLQGEVAQARARQ